jgi:hypothetical protein
MATILGYVAAAIIGLWGVAHVVPTRQVSPDSGTLRSSLTGARTPVVWFKSRPVLLAGSAGLLLSASFS